MYEIEAKVAINKRDFCRLQKELKKTAKFEGKIKKSDIYHNNPKKHFIRIRKQNNEIIFNIKDKGCKKGIELNTEIEWKIKDEKKWKELLKKCEIFQTIRKTKNSELYSLDGFIIELNHIPRLGYFLEIERVVKSKSQIPKTKKELVDMFKKLGYSHKDFEKKYYLELLQEL